MDQPIRVLREELHQLIEQADERLLRMIHSVMQADLEADLSQSVRAELDRRLLDHEQNPEAGLNEVEVLEKLMRKYEP